MEELDFYTKKFEDGKISRREFMGRAVALGVAVGVASTMADEALAQSPKKGGHLRMGIGAGASDDTLDPATYGENFTQNMGFATRNYLTEIDREGNLVGELATEWGASDDAVQWTFKLRNDVEFHNGKTMDAEDVIASYNHHRNEDSVSAMKDIAKTITDMKAVDKNTVQFTLEAGNADFPYIVSDYHIAILPSKDGVAVWQDGGGTGGYMVENFEPGVRLDLKRHPNFFKGDERAHFDSGEILVMLDQVARTNALTTGEIDVMDRCELKTLHLLERDDNLRIEETTGTQHFTLPMRADTAPFNDINVRMAIKLSLDREALLRTLLRGHGALGNDHPISTANQYHNGNLPQREYDPDMAKWYLRQSGLGQPGGRYLPRRHRLRWRCRHRCAVQGARQGLRHRYHRPPGAQGRLLVGDLDAKGLVCIVLGRPADRGLDVLGGLRGRRQLERILLRAYLFQRTACGGPGRTRLGQAPRDVRPDAGYRSRRGQPDRSGVLQLRVRHEQVGAARPVNGGELGHGRSQGLRALVVRLSTNA